jgi:hypothetical protein
MKINKHLMLALTISPFLGIFIAEFLRSYLMVTYHNLADGSVVTMEADHLLSSLATAAIGGIIVGIPCMLLIGLPSYYVLKKYRLASPFAYGLIGFTGGMLALSVLVFDKQGASDQILSLGGLSFGGMGLTVSLIFWFIAVYLRNRYLINSNKPSSATGV